MSLVSRLPRFRKEKGRKGGRKKGQRKERKKKDA